MSARARLLVSVCVLGAAVALILALTTGGGNQPTQTTKTVTLGGPGHKQIALGPQAQAQVKQQAKEDAAGQDAKAESDLRDKTPPTTSELAKARAVAPPGAPVIPQSPTFASPSTPGCKDAFVRNYSNRPAGARVLIGVLHWTGSKPIPQSTQDDLAIVRWFDTPAAQASSNYITDDDGHCYYVVPETKKAWTQAAANPWAVSDEHVNIGSLPVYPTAAGRAAVVRLIRGWHARWKIPYRHGIVNQSTCVPIRSGFLAHRDLGPCGGGHPDIGVPSAVDSLIAQAKALDTPKQTAAQRKHDAWVAHRAKVHRIYVKKCATHARRVGGSCANLRSEARLLDRLIAR